MEEKGGDRPLPSRRPIRRILIAALVVLALVAVAAGVFVYLSARGRSVSTVQEMRSLYESGRYAEAARTGTTIVAADPEDLETRRVLALSLAADGDNRGAIAQYDAILAAQPSDHTSLFRRALLERVTGEMKAALADLQAAIKASPETLSYREELAKTYAMTGDGVRAAQVFERLIAGPGLTDQQRIGLLRQLAETYESAGLEDDARGAWKRLLKLSPRDPQALDAIRP